MRQEKVFSFYFIVPNLSRRAEHATVKLSPDELLPLLSFSDNKLKIFCFCCSSHCYRPDLIYNSIL